MFSTTNSSSDIASSLALKASSTVGTVSPAITSFSASVNSGKSSKKRSVRGTISSAAVICGL